MLQVRYWLCSPVQLPAVLAATDAHRSVWPSLELPAVSCATHAQLYTRLQTVSNTRGIPNKYDFKPRGLLRPLSDLRDALDHQEPQTRSLRGHRHHAAAITAELHPLQGIDCKTAVWPIRRSLKALGSDDQIHCMQLTHSLYSFQAFHFEPTGFHLIPAQLLSAGGALAGPLATL